MMQITLNAPLCAMGKGDRIMLAEDRPWWKRMWHWITRKKYTRHYVIISVKDATTFNVCPADDLPVAACPRAATFYCDWEDGTCDQQCRMCARMVEQRDDNRPRRWD